MKRFFLVLAALMATNNLPIYAEVQNTSGSFENNCLDDIDLDIDLELGAQRKKKGSDDVLACLKQTLSATGVSLKPNGTIVPNWSFKLTVVTASPETGVYRLQIDSTNPDNGLSFSHIFVLAKIGNQYFGRGTQANEFDIAVKANGRNLEVGYNVFGPVDLQISQIRAVFKLPKHCSQ